MDPGISCRALSCCNRKRLACTNQPKGSDWSWHQISQTPPSTKKGGEQAQARRNTGPCCPKPKRPPFPDAGGIPTHPSRVRHPTIKSRKGELALEGERGRLGLLERDVGAGHPLAALAGVRPRDVEVVARVELRLELGAVPEEVRPPVRQVAALEGEGRGDGVGVVDLRGGREGSIVN